jgi:hypothetical protein
MGCEERASHVTAGDWISVLNLYNRSLEGFLVRVLAKQSDVHK